ncbi:LuxR C-terminal-related transcriptional regulator [Haloechinothrix sp. LS1_15]|uniref:LuxR C-terminal-related transcriptional regulator n=1 Tax=Haloechinothrix sp. LS1_15 TaxID=2652248 RepID=UPI00294754E8|nr:LuxR C-terminal-related transcriptional regulator [Haloechinothrix sp. LS1_15]MDV6011465.1 helix-turn-helix transcriptional regulator [Haloechinothrix sp. LS1_15]
MPPGAADGIAVEDQVRKGMRKVVRLDGVSAAIGGTVSAGGSKLVLSELLDMRTCLLQGAVIRPGIGLGGVALQHKRPVAVENYVQSSTITHHFDRAVIADNLTAAVAIPMQVNGVVRGVIYAASRNGLPLGERTIDAAMGIVRGAAQEVAVEEEVQRRVQRIVSRQQEGGESVPVDELVEVREELVSIASSAADGEVRQRLFGLSERLTRSSRQRPVERGVMLSQRESDVLLHVAAGRTNAETAELLGVLPTTVKTHLKNTMRKLGTRNRIETLTAARRAGLLP